MQQDAGIYTCNGLTMQNKKGINSAGDIKMQQDAETYTCNGSTMQNKKAKVDKICEAAEKVVAGQSNASHSRHSIHARLEKAQLPPPLCISTELPLSMRGKVKDFPTLVRLRALGERVLLLRPLFLEHHPAGDGGGVSVIFDARSNRWHERRLDLPVLPHKLLASPPGLLIARGKPEALHLGWVNDEEHDIPPAMLNEVRNVLISLNPLNPLWFPVPNLTYGDSPFMVVVRDALVLVVLNMEDVSHVRIHNLFNMLESPTVIDIGVPELDIPLQFGGVDFLGLGEEHVFAMTVTSDSAVFNVQDGIWHPLGRIILLEDAPNDDEEEETTELYYMLGMNYGNLIISEFLAEERGLRVLAVPVQEGMPIPTNHAQLLSQAPPLEFVREDWLPCSTTAGMIGSKIFFYENPHLHWFDMEMRRWGYSRSPRHSDGQLFPISTCLG